MAATITSTATRITISGNYKAFTSTTGSTTTVIQYSTGDAPASGDAGRFLMWKNGVNTKDWEIRYIESATATTVTVGDGGFSSAPASGESFVISTNLADIQSAVPSACTVAGFSYSFNGRDWSLTSAAFLADVNISLDTEHSTSDDGWQAAVDCAVQFGRLEGGEANDSTITQQGCYISLNNTRPSSNTNVFAAGGSETFNGPIYNFYGTYVKNYTNAPSDWAFVRGIGPVRMIGSIWDGSIGGAFYHPASELVDSKFRGNDTTTTAWSIRATFTRSVSAAQFANAVAAFKNFGSFTGIFRDTVFDLNSLTDVVFINGNSDGGATLIDCTTFDDSYIFDGGSGFVHQGKSINYTLADSGGTGLTGAKVAVYDTEGTLQTAIQTSTSGAVDEIVTIFSKWQNANPSSIKSPFDIRIRKYGYVYQGFQSSVSEPIKQEVRLQTNSGLVSTEGQAAAITGIAINFATETITITSNHNTQNLYDYYQYQLAQSANMVYGEDLIRTGDTFDLDDWDIVVDGATYTGDITTTGTLTLLNSGTVVGSVTDSGGTEFSTSIEVTGLTSTNVYLEDNTGTQVDYQTNITGTYNYTAPLGSTGNWKLVIDRAGYIASVNTFTADGNLKSFSGSLTQLTQPSGAAMYLGSSSALLSVVPNPDGSRMNIRIGNGTVTAQQILDECEDALATNDGMKYLSNGGGRVEFAALPTGTFLFMKSNVRLIRDNVGDSSATVEAFVTSTDGIILDNTNGDVQFVTVTRAQQLIEYDHVIYIDAVNGTNASVYPYGTEANPVNSWSNAKTLADFYSFREIHFKGSLTLDSDAENYIFVGGGLNDILNTSTYSVAGSTFKEMNMLGSGTGARACETVNLINGITNLEGTFTLCAFNEQLSVAANADVIFSRCISGLPGVAAPQINLNTNSQVSIRDYDGGLTLSGSTEGCNTTADFTSGKCTLDNTNTGGVISVRGITSTAFTDNSVGATIDSTGVHEQPSEALTDYSADTKTNIKPSVSI